MKVNITKFAEFLGKSGQYVRLLVQQGMPAEGGGRRGQQVFIDTEKAIKWLLARERAKAEAELAPADATSEAATKRLRTAQADLAELEAAERRGELVSAEDVKQFVFRIANIAKGQIAALPSRCAASLAACKADTASIHAHLKGETDQTLNAIANELELFFQELAPSHD